MPQKKIPMRMCVGCRTMKEKRELIRVVLPPDGDANGIRIDFKGKKNGRGAYLCHDEACLAKAKKTRALERALASEAHPNIKINDEIFAQLSEQMKFGGDPV